MVGDTDGAGSGVVSVAGVDEESVAVGKTAGCARVGEDVGTLVGLQAKIK